MYKYLYKLSVSDICNIVSIFKFDLQLAQCNERVGGGSRDERGRQRFSDSRNHESAGIFMDIYKEMSIEKG